MNNVNNLNDMPEELDEVRTVSNRDKIIATSKQVSYAPKQIKLGESLSFDGLAER